MTNKERQTLQLAMRQGRPVFEFELTKLAYKKLEITNNANRTLARLKRKLENMYFLKV